MKLSTILAGNKTYGAAATTIAGAALSYATGELTGAQAIQLAVTGVLAIFLRAGSKADAASVTPAANVSTQS